MSFLTNLLQGIGSAASTVGQGIGTAATAVGKGASGALQGAGEAAAKMKNPVTGAIEQTPQQQGFWGQLAESGKSPIGQLIQRNLKFGGGPIQQPHIPAYRLQGAKGMTRPTLNLSTSAPSLPKGGGSEFDEKDMALIKKLGEDWAKSRADKAAYQEYVANQGKTPSWSGVVEEAYNQPSYEAPTSYPEANELYGSPSTYEPTPIDWEDYYRFYYSNHQND